MRFLMVGAGALGGYFGGRLIEAGADVTFLLRPRRAAQLAATGLVVQSRFGDLHLPAPRHVLAEQIETPFDVVIVSCKAYDLPQTMASFAPAVGPDTIILPLLNGMRHIDLLTERFGEAAVLGGLCMISATLDGDGTVQHLNDMHLLSFGERDGTQSSRVDALAAAFGAARFDSRATPAILHEMWEKWVFIASAASLTGMMRATVGDVVAAGGAWVAEGLLAESAAIARGCGFAPREEAMARARGILSAPGSPFMASMLKDIERGAAIEADHIVGDLLARCASPAAPLSLLRVALGHLKAYEARRAREASGQPAR